jgi:hypothetical protein
MIAEASSTSAAENNNQQEECYYLCFSRADRIVTVVDDHGEYITDLKLCGKCYHMLDPNFKKFKWRYINVNINNINSPQSRYSL